MELTNFEVVKKWIYFTFNYPYRFIEQCWAEDTHLAAHIRSKFESYGGDVNRLWCELDTSNREKLVAWVMVNYQG